MGNITSYFSTTATATASIPAVEVVAPVEVVPTPAPMEVAPTPAPMEVAPTPTVEVAPTPTVAPLKEADPPKSQNHKKKRKH